MTKLKGLEGYSFNECLEKAGWAEFDNVRVPFLHLNQLMASKEAANRPKDQMDLEELRRIECIQKKIEGK